MSQDNFRNYGQDKVDYQYSFRGLSGPQANCRIRIFEGKEANQGRAVVVATELKDNPGTSITNFAEQLAGLITDKHVINPEKLIWIEHYHEGTIHETFDYVTFHINRTGVFSNPSWVHITKSDVEDMIEGSL